MYGAGKVELPRQWPTRPRQTETETETKTETVTKTKVKPNETNQGQVDIGAFTKVYECKVLEFF